MTVGMISCLAVRSLTAQATDARPTEFLLAAECAIIGDNFDLRPGDGTPLPSHVIYRGQTATDTPPPDVPANRIRFTVDAEAGEYYFFAYIRAPDSGSDSYWLRINNGEWFAWARDLTTTDFAWKVISGPPLPLTAGINTIDFAYRESNISLAKLAVNAAGVIPLPEEGLSTVGCKTLPSAVQMGGAASLSEKLPELDTAGESNLPVEPSPESHATAVATEARGEKVASEVIAGPRDEFWLEAECATVGASFARSKGGAAPESAYVTYRGTPSMSEAPVDEAANRVRFVIEQATAGEYQLYARVKAPDGDSDSFWVRINDGAWIKWASGLRTPTFAWKAVAAGTYSLTDGTNTIDIAYREPNAQLDKLYLRIGGLRPTGLGSPSAVNCN
ncbi:hypothetical protein [Neolewinella sp.]|uniref:hypothetical protein n=1 Tax=Neolewinella sp. TaxID=2993543 RepID=UPI003B51B3D7